MKTNDSANSVNTKLKCNLNGLCSEDNRYKCWEAKQKCTSHAKSTKVKCSLKFNSFFFFSFFKLILVYYCIYNKYI
jgi:hypothetical protein